ncbi:MAG: addiction module protein [Verrucomicrobiae bacterium]|nr:addiction module protein [Verrucomicrobiae bacterium]
MITPHELSAALQELPVAARAQLAVELIDSLGDETWSDEALAALADERDAELESRSVDAMGYDQFVAGLRRPAEGA